MPIILGIIGVFVLVNANGWVGTLIGVGFIGAAIAAVLNPDEYIK